MGRPDHLSWLEHPAQVSLPMSENETGHFFGRIEKARKQSALHVTSNWNVVLEVFEVTASCCPAACPRLRTTRTLHICDGFGCLGHNGFPHRRVCRKTGPNR